MGLTRAMTSTYLARRFARGRRRVLSRVNALCAAGFGTGVLALLLVLSMMGGFEAEMVRRIVGTSAHVFVPGLSRAEGRLVEQRLAGHPALESAWLQVDETAALLTAAGMEVAHLTAVAKGLDLPDPGTGYPGLLLGNSLARSAGLGVGDAVVVVVPAPAGPGRPPVARRTFTVAATFEGGVAGFDDARVMIDLADARGFLADDRVTAAARARDPRDIESVGAALRDALGPDHRVATILELHREFFRLVRAQKLVIAFVVGLILLAAGVSVTSTLILGLAVRRRALGVLLSMGVAPRTLVAANVLQGLFVAGLGIAAGTALAVTLALVLDQGRIIRLDPAVYYLEYLPFRVRPRDVLGTMSIALGMAVLGTVVPAWRAGRLDPIEVLRDR